MTRKRLVKLAGEPWYTLSKVKLQFTKTVGIGDSSTQFLLWDWLDTDTQFVKEWIEDQTNQEFKNISFDNIWAEAHDGRLWGGFKLIATTPTGDNQTYLLEINALIDTKITSSITKKENTVPYNGNRPKDNQLDPEEEEDEGYGGDRLGLWVSPKGAQAMKVVLTSNLGTLNCGDKVVVTGAKKDKVVFYAEKDPSIVGIAAWSYFESETRFNQKKAKVNNFIKCHANLSKSPAYITKLATDFTGLIDDSVLQQLEEIKTNISTNKEKVVNSLPISPQINARIRLADAAQFFSLKGIVPTEQQTYQYIKTAMAAHTGLPETNWTDDMIRSAIFNKSSAMEWSDKMLLMYEWHQANKLPLTLWDSLQQVLGSEDLNDIKVGIESLFDKATQAVQSKTADMAPEPQPIESPGDGYEWALNSQTGKWFKKTKQGY